MSNQGPSDIHNSYRDVSISYLAGIIDSVDVMGFRRLLFRATRGKVLVYFKQSKIEIESSKGEKLNKSVYVIVFQEGLHFFDKLMKLCDSFSGKRFQLPGQGHSDRHAFSSKIQKVQEKIKEIT